MLAIHWMRKMQKEKILTVRRWIRIFPYIIFFTPFSNLSLLGLKRYMRQLYVDHLDNAVVPDAGGHHPAVQRGQRHQQRVEV